MWAAAAMQIPWKKCQFNSHAQDCFGTPTLLVTVSLFWDTKIVVVISCENALFNLHVSYYSSRFCDNLNIIN